MATTRTETDIVRFITPGVIAEKIGVPIHRVLHVLSTRKHIRPRARAGTLRLYNNEAVAAVRHELNAMDARRGRRKPSDCVLEAET